MLDLGGANAMRQSAKGTMRGGMAVAAHNGQAGQGKALLGPGNMDNALANIIHRQIINAELGAIFFQRLDLQLAFRVVNRVQTASAVCRRNIVIGHG